MRQLILDLVDARNPGRQPLGLLAGDTRLRRRTRGLEAALGAVQCGAGLFGRRRSGLGDLPCAGLLQLGLGTLGLQCDQGLGPARTIGDQCLRWVSASAELVLVAATVAAIARA